MNSENVPERCLECSKSSVIRYHRKCGFCQDLEFEEGVLCELNRATQKIDDFKCHAFEPRLKVVTPDKIKEPSPIDRYSKQESY